MKIPVRMTLEEKIYRRKIKHSFSVEEWEVIYRALNAFHSSLFDSRGHAMYGRERFISGDLLLTLRKDLREIWTPFYEQDLPF